jgi:predicted aspartyl protease
MDLMPQEIVFDVLHEYDTLEIGIVVPTILKLGGDSADVKAKVDTGSAFCVFERVHGLRLGLEIETGMPLRMMTATGAFDTFGHTINVSVLGIEIEATVYFAAEESFYLNILGRQGFLDRVKLGLITTANCF